MNWRHVITLMVAAGLTQSQIATACGCGQSTISELYRGFTQDPRWSLGQSLLALAESRGLDLSAARQASSGLGEQRSAAAMVG